MNGAGGGPGLAKQARKMVAKLQDGCQARAPGGLHTVRAGRRAGPRRPPPGRQAHRRGSGTGPLARVVAVSSRDARSRRVLLVRRAWQQTVEGPREATAARETRGRPPPGEPHKALPRAGAGPETRPEDRAFPSSRETRGRACAAPRRSGTRLIHNRFKIYFSFAFVYLSL